MTDNKELTELDWVVLESLVNGPLDFSGLVPAVREKQEGCPIVDILVAEMNLRGQGYTGQKATEAGAVNYELTELGKEALEVRSEYERK